MRPSKSGIGVSKYWTETFFFLAAAGEGRRCQLEGGTFWMDRHGLNYTAVAICWCEKFDFVFNLRICLWWKHLKWNQLAPFKFLYQPIATTIQTKNHFKTTLPIGDTSISIGNLYKQRLLAFVISAEITLLYFNFIWSFSNRAFNNSSHYILIFCIFEWQTSIPA